MLDAIPFVGPFIAAGVAAITAAVGVAGMCGFLGSIITPLVSGLRITILRQGQSLKVLGAGGPDDPEVDVRIAALSANILYDKPGNELAVSVDFAP